MSNWKVGNEAGHCFDPDTGDLSVARWVTTPTGKLMLLVTITGFRDKPDGGVEKVVLDRKIVSPTTSV
jgi:hypothetical protein